MKFSPKLCQEMVKLIVMEMKDILEEGGVPKLGELESEQMGILQKAGRESLGRCLEAIDERLH